MLGDVRIMNSHPKICYILGAGHCGSTLLNLLLNGHSNILGLSEIYQLPGDLNDIKNLTSSNFWTEVEKFLQSSREKSFKDLSVDFPTFIEALRWPEDKKNEWCADNKALFQSLHEISECRYLVDSSKWHHRLYLLSECYQVDLQVIHLVRDGRAIINSYYRKYSSFFTGFRRWLSPSIAAFYLKNKIGTNHWLQVHYEQLADHPEKILRTICTFLDLEYEEKMLSFRNHEYYGVGGNRMRTRDDDTIRKDESWKQELSTRNRLLFNILGGWLNKYYGY